MTTELAKNKTIEETMKITEDDIAEASGSLPDNKKHCSNLGVKALRRAIEDYFSRNRKVNSKQSIIFVTFIKW